MRFGAVTHAVGHHLSFEATLAAIKQLGFDSILLLANRSADTVSAAGTCKDAFPNVLDSDPAHVLKAVGDAGLEIGALHYAGALDLGSDAGVEAFLAGLSEYAECALAMGCKHLTHPCPSCGRSRVPTEEKTTEISRLAACMNAVAERFADRGLRVAVDIHHKGWVEGVDDCRLLLDSMPCPNAGVLLNIGHLTTAEAYGWLLVDEYPDRLPVIGWKDHSLAKNRPQPMWSLELGTAHSPFALYVEAFERHPGERVHLINCEHAPEAERADALRRSREYLSQLWGAVA